MSSHLIAAALLWTDSSPSIDPVRDSLILASDCRFVCVLIFSGVVALGCLLEIGDTYSAVRRWYRRKYCGIAEEENPLSWNIPTAAIGLLLVVAGIVGETICESLVSKAETAVRAHDEQLLTQATLEAGSAKQSSIVAACKAKEAKADADIALKDAGAAIDSANAVTKKLVNADERLRKLNLFLTPKSLTANETSALSDAFRKLPDHDAWILVVGESNGLNFQVVGALRQAGFERASEVDDSTNLPYGMAMTGPRRYAYLMQELTSILLREHVGPMMGAPGFTSESEPIKIFVGDVRTGPLPSVAPAANR